MLRGQGGRVRLSSLGGLNDHLLSMLLRSLVPEKFHGVCLAGETLCAVAPILVHGAQWYQDLGLGEHKGTKVISLSGDVTRPGNYEVPIGLPLMELINERPPWRWFALGTAGSGGGAVSGGLALETGSSAGGDSGAIIVQSSAAAGEPSCTRALLQCASLREEILAAKLRDA